MAVLIPAHDEAERIAATVEAALAIDGVTRVVVVDDGSEDDTAILAERAGAKVVRMFGNAGKGGALEAGAKRVENADIVLLLDGDLGETASQGAALLGPIVAGEADMTIATFPRPEGKAGFGFVMRLARWGIVRYGGPFTANAPLSGQRAITGECLARTRPFLSGYGVEVGLTVRALRAGFRLLEVPTTMAHAATGRDVSGFVHRGRQFVHVSLALAKLASERHHAGVSDDRSA
ncbi:MAG: glycosyltransferase family 2 protein [Coriobacteriia bacterium]|nr:glycosyltransferase family 2 protein [Coriobacteriia bacterium]